VIVPSIRALASVLGISHTALNGHLKRGKFAGEPGGGFDTEKVRASLKKNADLQQPSQAKGPRPQKPPERQPEREPEEESAHAEFNRFHAYREKLRAKRDEMDLKERMRDLISVDEARKTWHAIGKMYASSRENVPMQLAPRLVGKTDLIEIEGIIRSFYRESDTRVANEIESRYGETLSGGEHSGRGDRR
jgi:hypothetical protein